MLACRTATQMDVQHAAHSHMQQLHLLACALCCRCPIRLSLQIGDAECGSTLAKGAAAIQRQLACLPLSDPAGAAVALGRTCGRSMGGTSGGVVSRGGSWAAAAAAAAGNGV
jgi:hypothetical protein